MKKRIPPKPGQESVWDYPRPPRLEAASKQIQVFASDELIVDTGRAYRVLETSHPPTYYLPPEDIRMEFFKRLPGGGSFCEWKGQAHYYDMLIGGRHAPKIAWAYDSPSRGFEPIKGYLALYAHMVDRATVGGEVVTPQPGNFYGGWITPDIVGPFKGAPGTWGW